MRTGRIKLDFISIYIYLYIIVVHLLAFAHAEGRMMIEMFQAMWVLGSMGGGGEGWIQHSHHTFSH